jgi:uncharacterized RDD family membrane protein YckC
MACPLCGERCSCSYASGDDASVGHVSVLIDPEISASCEESFEASLAAPVESPARYRTIELEAPVPLRQPAPPPPPISEEQWRSEVTSRVKRYRRRKGYDDSNACLSLDFESAAVPQPEAEPAAFMDVRFYQDPKDYKPAEGEPVFFRQRREPVEAPKIIEFPRPAAEELAEPVLDRPRILEAAPPEQLLLETPPPLAIMLEPEAEPEAPFGAMPVFDVPIQVAPLPLRVLAAGLDWLLVLVAAAIFALVVARLVDTMPQGKAAMGLTLLTVGFFWAIYQYVFLVYGAMTPGMQFAGLRLQHFDGEPAACAERRNRALALVLSCVSLGLGFAWALVDEDTLCWHDRISRTYLSN